MPNPTIDPDAAEEHARKRLAVIESAEANGNNPAPEAANILRHRQALVEAAREAAKQLEEMIADQIFGNAHYELECEECGRTGLTLRKIGHGQPCPIGTATVALLALEPLLPTEKEE